VAKKNPTGKGKEIVENIGLLIASGLIAGQALMGIVTSGIEALKEKIKLPEIEGSGWLGLLIFFILGFILIYFPYKKMISSGEHGKS
jgi:hypothetical protein